jgi:HJR/Mrr/RecB family endonuclease
MAGSNGGVGAAASEAGADLIDSTSGETIANSFKNKAENMKNKNIAEVEASKAKVAGEINDIVSRVTG